MSELTEVPPTGSETESALVEFVMRAIREAGDVGIQKRELVAAAREAGILHDGISDDRAKLLMGFALGTTKKFFASVGEYQYCDPKGGSINGHRYRLTDRAEEAHDDRQRATNRMSHILDNMDVSNYAECVRFDPNGTIRVEIMEEAFRLARKAFGWLASTHMPAEPVKPKSRRKAKTTVDQESLL